MRYEWSQALQSATKTADKKHGGQGLDLLTITSNTDFGMPRDTVKQEIYRPAQKLFCIAIIPIFAEISKFYVDFPYFSTYNWPVI